MSLPVEELVNQTNRDLRHLRNHKDSSNKVDERNNSASQKSILYIQEFWPHLCNVIRSDPERLGLSLVLNDSREDIILKADDLKTAFLEDHQETDNRDAVQKLAGILSSMALMEKTISLASQNWASSFASDKKNMLPFNIDSDEFVSLRMLLPQKRQSDTIPRAEAPTLVTGGTMTAVYLCWNWHRDVTLTRSGVSSQMINTRQL